MPTVIVDLRRRLISLGGKISVAEFMLLTKKKSFRVVFVFVVVVVASFFFLHSFSPSLFLCADVEHFFFL